MVVVPGVAADVDHGVDGARTAERLATRLIEEPIFQVLLRRGPELPVAEPAADKRNYAAGHQYEGAAFVFLAGLDEADTLAAVVGEPIGESATRGAATH